MEVLRDNLEECGLPGAVAAVGERWTLMILRAAFNGVRNFEDFLSLLGIARNILANRLAKLVELEIMQRVPMQDDRRKVEYRLTDKGIDLLPALLALRQWGEKHGLGVPSNPVLTDSRDNLPVELIRLHAADGRVIEWRDLHWLDRTQVGKRSEELA
jgi:DNA-binding HxlR family transcriptional regulator